MFRKFLRWWTPLINRIAEALKGNIYESDYYSQRRMVEHGEMIPANSEEVYKELVGRYRERGDGR